LTSAKRYWGDWTPYSGQQFGFEYDNIGNRKKAWVGGDNQGANLREISYTANSLNQYSSVLTPGAAHIAGIAFATNTVAVNSGAPERRVEWFDREISIANTNSPVWQQVSITAGTVSSNGGFVFPKYNQTLSYDADGNLTNDGVWSYEWDGENRLMGMSMADIPNAQRKRLEFGYDFMGRRFSKVVKTWDGSAFSSPVTNLFVYDGWNLLATLNSQLSTLNSFLWGQDLSGTMTEAGGVGGLLAMFEGGNAHFATYDGNGNVTGLIKQDKSTSARYEYSPYGETLRATGPMASANLFRWSTKLWDDEAGLIIYPSRVLHARFGRWLSRDPEGEQAGLNLFAFLGNSPLNDVDPLGRSGLLDVLLGNSQDNESYIIELKRGETLRSRIQDVVDSLNDLQQFQAGVMDAQGLDIGDLVQSIGATRMALSQNLRGVKSGAKAAALVDDMHHIFPKASGLLKFFNANKIDPNGALIAINGYMHRYGLHGRSVGGGIYNEIWEEFAEKNAEMKNNPWYVIGFGFGLFDRVAPLLL